MAKFRDQGTKEQNRVDTCVVYVCDECRSERGLNHCVKQDVHFSCAPTVYCCGRAHMVVNTVFRQELEKQTHLRLGINESPDVSALVFLAQLLDVSWNPREESGELS